MMADISEIDNNELAALDGLSLKEALESFILAPAFNSEFATHIAKCIPKEFEFGGKEGWLTDKFWNVRNPELATEHSARCQQSWLKGWRDPVKLAGIETSELEIKILKQVERNIVQLHNWLTQGALASTGRPDEFSGGRETIPSDVWARRIQIDFEKGDLSRGRQRREVGALWLCSYANIRLCVPVVEQANPADELLDKRSNDALKIKRTGGRPTEKLWVEALDRAMVRWLDKGQPKMVFGFQTWWQSHLRIWGLTLLP